MDFSQKQCYELGVSPIRASLFNESVDPVPAAGSSTVAPTHKYCVLYIV